MRNDNEPALPTAPVDVAVVGGGLAGLTAAATAARHGARTALVEAGGLGGRARTDDRNGVSLNLGPHALYRNGVGTRLLADLGVVPTGGVPVASGPLFANGRVGAVPTNVRTTLTTRALSVRSRFALASFVSRVSRIDTTALREVPIGEYLSATTDREDLRTVLHTLVRLATYTHAPDLLSAGAAIEQLVVALGGVLYLDHGWGSLVDELTKVVRRHGAVISTGTTVRTIETSGRKFALDTTAGTVDAATVIVAGLTPHAAGRLAVDDGDALSDVAGPPARAACLDLTLNADPPHTFALDGDRALYYSVQSGVADLAPAGTTLASLVHYRRVGDDAHDRTADRAMLTDFATRLGIDASDDARYLHDMVVVNAIPRAGSGSGGGRPGVHELSERFDRPGVFLAGDWVGPTGMLADTAIASGVAAASAAIAAVGHALA